MWRVGLFVIGLLAPVLLCAQDTVVAGPQSSQGNSRRSSPWPEYPADVVERGRQQFVKTCAFCHGQNATGGSNGPNLVQSALVRHDENGNLIEPLLRQGRPEKGMPAFQLSQTQMTEVGTFLHSRVAASDLKSAGRPNQNYSIDKLLTGNAQAGKAFFKGAGKCSTCHSPEGDLAKIASKYEPVVLQARFLYPPDQRVTATVTDGSGKQYRGAIKLLTNYDVAIQEESGWYHSWPLDTVTLTVSDSLSSHLKLLSRYSDAEMHDVFAYLETLK